MWIVGAVTNTGYDGMPHGGHISKLRSLERGSVADKPHTFCCPSVSVVDITACATSPARFLNLLIIFLAKKLWHLRERTLRLQWAKMAYSPTFMFGFFCWHVKGVLFIRVSDPYSSNTNLDSAYTVHLKTDPDPVLEPAFIFTLPAILNNLFYYNC